MLNNLLLYIDEEGIRYFGNADGSGKFLEALLYAFVGFCITFIGISILILFVWICGKIIGKARMKKVGDKPKLPPAETAALPAEEERVEEEIRVAIIAAIAAYYADESRGCEFKVKRIKRI